VTAQESVENSFTFSIGDDFYSNYNWCSPESATGHAFQPSVIFITGRLTIGGMSSLHAAEYSFPNLRIIAGTSNGWLASNGQFRICTLGIGSCIVNGVNGEFLSGSDGPVIFNPGKKHLYPVAGFSS
jgi:hypothetical protein